MEPQPWPRDARPPKQSGSESPYSVRLTSLFGGGISVLALGPDNVRDPRPASSVAARRLWDDLKNINLADGTFPQLR